MPTEPIYIIAVMTVSALAGIVAAAAIGTIWNPSKRNFAALGVAFAAGALSIVGLISVLAGLIGMQLPIEIMWPLSVIPLASTIPFSITGVVWGR